MSKVKIKKADVLPKGTQLKMLFYLDGNQKVRGVQNFKNNTFRLFSSPKGMNAMRFWDQTLGMVSTGTMPK